MKRIMQPLPICEREDDIARAARSGIWTEDLRAHAAECVICADTALVTVFLAREEDVTVPDAGLLWWKSELRRKLEAREKAAAPLRWAEGSLAGALLFGAAYLATSPAAQDNMPLMVAGTLVLSLGAAGSWFFFSGARK